jgi:peroxiredoxin
MNFPVLARAFLAALLLAGVSACTPKKPEPPTAPKVTADSLPKIGPAPAWELQDVNGKPVSSEQFKGKVVVVDFWATWCLPCKMEIPGYIELVKKYEKDGFAMVGVSMDTEGPEVVKDFMQKNGLNYTVVMADEKVSAAFGGVEVMPTTLLIDRSGQIRDRKEGAEETATYEQKVKALLN